MKDAIGQEVVVGDTVAVITGGANRAKVLKRKTVVKVTPKGITTGEWEYVKPTRFVKVMLVEK